jgi:glutathione S-transferase
MNTVSLPRLYDYAASANCYKVRLLLAQLDLPYERIPVDIFAGETLTDDYAAKNPARATPVLEPVPGEFLPESNAILRHLAEGTPLLPDDPAERAQVFRWLFFEQADVVPAVGGLRFRLITGRIAPDGDEAARRRRGSERCSACSTPSYGNASSCSTAATPSPTSASTATSTSHPRPGSSSTVIRR